MGTDSTGTETERSEIKEGFSEEDRITFMKKFLEQQREERQGVIRKNGLQFLLSFLILIVGLLGVRSYHRQII